MNIALYSSSLFKKEKPDLTDFIVETFFLFIQQHSEHRCIIITDEKPPEQISFSPNTEMVFVKPIPENALLKKIWLDVKLSGVLKKIRADFFISFDNVGSSTVSIPQCIVIQHVERTKAAYIKKAQLLIVTNKLMKFFLIEKHKIQEEKIAVIYPVPNKMYEVINTEEKETIKNKYSDGKEFFLFNSIFPGKDDFINLLKSFSHFKKRQQSSYKLLLTTETNSFLEKTLEGYKYRNDVKFINTNDKKDHALILASAYAVLLPFSSNEDLLVALNAMRSGVPVISVKNSVVSEVAGDAALYAETNAIKDMGEKMMLIYTNENARSKLIEKGKQVAGTYTYEKAAKLLGQSILKVLR